MSEKNDNQNVADALSSHAQATGDQPANRREFTGRHMLFSIVAFFGVVIAANLTMAYFALSSWTGLVVKNSYIASQNFNEVLEEAESQKARGWKNETEIDSRSIKMKLMTKEGEPVSGFRFVASLEKSVHAKDDFKISLNETDKGIYQGKFELQPGVWRISLKGKDARGRSFRSDFEADLTDLIK